MIRLKPRESLLILVYGKFQGGRRYIRQAGSRVISVRPQWNIKCTEIQALIKMLNSSGQLVNLEERQFWLFWSWSIRLQFWHIVHDPAGKRTSVPRHVEKSHRPLILQAKGDGLWCQTLYSSQYMSDRRCSFTVFNIVSPVSSPFQQSSAARMVFQKPDKLRDKTLWNAFQVCS